MKRKILIPIGIALIAVISILVFLIIIGNDNKENNTTNNKNINNNKIKENLLINSNGNKSENKIVFPIEGIVVYNDILDDDTNGQKIEKYKTPGLLAVDFSVYEGIKIDDIATSKDESSAIANNSSISIYDSLNSLVNYEINSLDMYVKIDEDIVSDPTIHPNNILLAEDGRWSLWKYYNEYSEHDFFTIYYQTGGKIGEFNNYGAFLKIKIGTYSNIASGDGDNENFIIDEYQKLKNSLHFYTIDENDYLNVKDLNGQSFKLEDYLYLNDVFTAPLNTYNINLKSQNLSDYYKSGSRILSYLYKHNDYNLLYKVNMFTKTGFTKLGSGEGISNPNVNEISLDNLKLKIEKPTADTIGQLLVYIKINEDDYMLITILSSQQLTYDQFVDGIKQDLN